MSTEARQALAELVALKELKAQYESTGNLKEFMALKAEYGRRQPLAWAAARAALAEGVRIPNPLHKGNEMYQWTYMPKLKYCCYCGREGHLSHSCPFRKENV